jgi:hypothetical protein
MTDLFTCEPYIIHRGSALDVLPNLPMVDSVITSPPYFKQRSYGTNPNELGREPSVGEYITKLVNVFRAIPLEPWGSIWVNLGDKRGKRGELLRIPHLFADEMSKAGFYLIDEVVWAKESVQVDGRSVGHCMIEPATRRLNGNGWRCGDGKWGSVLVNQHRDRATASLRPAAYPQDGCWRIQIALIDGVPGTNRMLP